MSFLYQLLINNIILISIFNIYTRTKRKGGSESLRKNWIIKQNVFGIY